MWILNKALKKLEAGVEPDSICQSSNEKFNGDFISGTCFLHNTEQV